MPIASKFDVLALKLTPQRILKEPLIWQND